MQAIIFTTTSQKMVWSVNPLKLLSSLHDDWLHCLEDKALSRGRTTTDQGSVSRLAWLEKKRANQAQKLWVMKPHVTSTTSAMRVRASYSLAQTGWST